MTANRATGADDPALAETTWPLPISDDSDSSDGLSLESRLRAHHADYPLMLEAAETARAYRALIEDGTTAQQLKRLAALRRVHRRRLRQ